MSSFPKAHMTWLSPRLSSPAAAAAVVPLPPVLPPPSSPPMLLPGMPLPQLLCSARSSGACSACSREGDSASSLHSAASVLLKHCPPNSGACAAGGSWSSSQHHTVCPTRCSFWKAAGPPGAASASWPRRWKAVERLMQSRLCHPPASAANSSCRVATGRGREKKLCYSKRRLIMADYLPRNTRAGFLETQQVSASR